jgi:hypothetical protein
LAASPSQRTQPPSRFSPKHSSSGIDPILLTKSDQLIKAELQLKRQQIERALNDQVDRRIRYGDKDNNSEEARHDCEDIFRKAQELVKPVSGFQAVATNSEENESFDENSYYSSKANSWGSEDVESSSNANAADAVAAHPLSQKKQSPTSKNPQQKEADVPMIDLDADDEEEAYEPAEEIEIYEGNNLSDEQGQGESDYSPPPATRPTVGTKMNRRGGQNRSRGNRNGNGYDYMVFLFSLYLSLSPYLFASPFQMCYTQNVLLHHSVVPLPS